MPSARRRHGRRTEIAQWCVKHGKKAGDEFAGSKGDCKAWIKSNQASYPDKLRLIPPNA